MVNCCGIRVIKREIIGKQSMLLWESNTEILLWVFGFQSAPQVQAAITHKPPFLHLNTTIACPEECVYRSVAQISIRGSELYKKMSEF